MLQKIQPYAKAAVAVGGLLVVAGNIVLTGQFDQDALVQSAVAVAVAFGVYRIPNKA